MIARLRRAPVRVQGTLIDAPTAAGLLQRLSLTPDGAAEIPWIAHSAVGGDWRPLAVELDRAGATADEASRKVMYMSIVCNEPWARWRPGRVAVAASGMFLAERSVADARMVAAGCRGVPKIAQPAWSRARVRSSASTSRRCCRRAFSVARPMATREKRPPMTPIPSRYVVRTGSCARTPGSASLPASTTATYSPAITMADQTDATSPKRSAT